MSYAVLIDVGGTFLKGTTVRSGAENVGQIRRRSGPRLVSSGDGSAVLDPNELRTAVELLCQELIVEEGGLPSSIFLTGQMHGLVVTEIDGTPSSEVITWRDALKCRIDGTDESAIAIIRNRCSVEDLKHFGNELREGLPIATLLSRTSMGLDITGQVPHSLISFCAAALTGFSKFPLMHATDAAAHGFYDVVRKKWGENALAELGLSGMVLPEVVDDVVPCGRSINYGCPVYVALGDQQASLYGMFLEPGELSLNIATGSQVSAIDTTPSFSAQVRPFFDGTYLSTITHIPAGRALNALMSLVAEMSNFENDELWQIVSEKTLREDQSDLRIDLSFFPSVTGSSGEISGISETNLTVGQLFRSAVNEMAKQYRHFSRVVFPNDEFKNIVVSGGLASRFPPLMQEIKRVFGGYSYRVSSSEDASLAGLRRLSEELNR